MPCPKSLEVSKNHIKIPKFLYENILFCQFIWMWHFVSRRCDYFQFFAIMISLIWNDSILSNTHPFEGNTCRWCLVASPPHTEDSWVGEMGWEGVCLVCLRGVPSLRLLPRQCPSVPRELYHPHCSILPWDWGVPGLKMGIQNRDKRMFGGRGGLPCSSALLAPAATAVPKCSERAV